MPVSTNFEARELALLGFLKDSDRRLGNEARSVVGVEVSLRDIEFVFLFLRLGVPGAQLFLKSLQLRIVDDLNRHRRISTKFK